MSAAMIERVVEVELLEDLHSGAGVGNAALDALLATDHRGQPMLFWSHIKGVLAERTSMMFDPATRARWFGDSGDQSGAICLTSARPVDVESRLLPHSSTARRTFSRGPSTDTLRTVDHLAAGTRLTASVQLPADLLPDFQILLRTVDALGSQRRRGAGVVRVDIADTGDLQCSDVPCIPGKRLRLLLRALDPISLPQTSTPTTSLVHGGSFIRGQTLAGALTNAALTKGGDAQLVAEAIWQRTLTVLDALPLPLDLSAEEASSQLASLEVWPVPADWRMSKATTATNSSMPWWCEPPSVTLSQLGSRSPPEDALLLRQPQDQWSWYCPTTRYRLRIQVRGEGKDPDLFAQHELVEDSLFVADLLLPADAQVSAALQTLLSSGSWLRTGRGGRPLQLLKAVAMDLPAAPDTGACLLWSDAILRDPATLETVPILDEGNISTLLPGARQPLTSLGAASPPAAGVVVSGFNFASRLPRQPLWAIRRGARLEFGVAPGGTAVGERQHEGFGQLRAIPELPDAIEARAAPLPSGALASAEDQLHRLAQTLAGAHAETLSRVSRSNRSEFANALARKTPAADVVSAAKNFVGATTARCALQPLVRELEQRQGDWPDHLARLAELTIAFSLTMPSAEDTQ